MGLVYLIMAIVVLWVIRKGLIDLFGASAMVDVVALLLAIMWPLTCLAVMLVIIVYMLYIISMGVK